MTPLDEQIAALLLAEHAFDPAAPGLVGATVELPLRSPGPDGRVALRHGFLTSRSPRLAVVSGPPSPGLEASIARMTDDLETARSLLGELDDDALPDDMATGGVTGSRVAGTVGGDGITVGGPAVAGGTGASAAAPSAAPAGGAGAATGGRVAGGAPTGGAAAGGVRVALEAGLEGGGPLGLTRRWALAQALAPVLAAAFANTPARDGRRSTRQARHRHLAVLRPVHDPRRAWAAYVLEQPGLTRPRLADLARHADSLRPPVAARGHLEIDVADRQPGDGWRVVVAVTAVLLDDPRTAARAEQITAPLAAEPGLWERAARDSLSDPVLAAAARACFVEAYATLARHGAARDLRDEVAEFTERYVMRGRCPADDVLDTHVGPARR